MGETESGPAMRGDAMKQISKAKRAFLLAVVRDTVCRGCGSAPAIFTHVRPECGPCMVKRCDATGEAVGIWL
jgi:hypothetical protein